MSGVEEGVKAVKKQKSSIMSRLTLKAKLRAPTGATLSEGETLALAEAYESDAQIVRENQKEVAKAIKVASKIDVVAKLRTAREVKAQAIGVYKRTKDPIKKREWARRIVVATSTIQALAGMTKRMSAAKDRLTMIAGDLELQLVEAEARATESRAYAEAGKQLRLVGQKLVDARSRATNVDMEYSNLEANMEGAEKFIDKREIDEIIKEAEQIVGDYDQEVELEREREATLSRSESRKL